jgi:hypothetical protein
VPPASRTTASRLAFRHEQPKYILFKRIRHQLAGGKQLRFAIIPRMGARGGQKKILNHECAIRPIPPGNTAFADSKRMKRIAKDAERQQEDRMHGWLDLAKKVFDAFLLQASVDESIPMSLFSRCRWDP